MKPIKRRIFFVFTIAVFLSLVCGLQVNAIDKIGIKSKAALEGIYQCYMKGAYKNNWILNHENENSDAGLLFIAAKLGGDTVKLPYGFTDAKDNNTNCKQVMKGFGSDIDGDSLNQGFVPKDVQSGNIAKVKNFFEKVGYNAIEETSSDSSGSEGQVLTYDLDVTQSNCEDKNGVKQTMSILRDGKDIGSQIRFPVVSINSDGKFAASSENIDVPAPGSGASSVYEVCDVSFSIIDEGGSGSMIYYMIENEYAETTDDNGYNSKDKDQVFNSKINGNNYITFKRNVKSASISSDLFTEYTMSLKDARRNSERAMFLVKGFNDNNNIGYKAGSIESYSDLKLTNQQVYDLYTYYLRDIYKIPVICEGEEGFEAYDNENFKDINWIKGKKCKVDLNYSKRESPSKKLYGVNGELHFTKEIDEDDIVDTLNKLSLNDVTTLEGGNLEDVTKPDDDDDGGIFEKVKETCRNQGGARKMGWILCSVMELAGEATNYIYEKAVEPALRVDTGLFTAMNEENAAKRAWETFRDIANVIFVILLLIVIFSQLTGVGIDNYGIKKILPKLIVAAILINLSYLICLIMVDISNIVGNGFQALFNSIGEGLNTSITIDGAVPDESVGGSEFVSTTGNLIGVGLLGTVVFMTGPIWATPAVALSLLTTAVGMLVAIVFLFFLLAARQAAIIILVTLSPIAIVCYILPNTKGIFDKWINLFKALLLVYPIAGLLVGGGNYVSKVILNMGGGGFEGFWLALIAMLSGIVPIFFLPNVVKGAFKMMGNLGAALTSAGDKLRGGVNKAGSAVGRSEKFRDIQAESNRNRQLRNAERTVRRLEGRDGLSARQTRRLARNTATLNKLRNEDRDAATLVAEQRYANRTEDELRADWNNAFDSGNVSELTALTDVMMSKYGAGGANFVGQALNDKNIIGNQNAINSMSALRENLQRNSTFSQLMRGKASDAFQMISNGGIVGRDNQTGELQYANLSHFSEHNAISTSNADWATQSAATLQRAYENGALSAEQAQEMLNSNDPSIQSGLQSDRNKRDVLQAAVYRHNNATIDPNLSTADVAALYRAEQSAAANAPTIRSSGAYIHNNGSTVQLHEMSDGTFVNAENNQVVDIRQYKRK